LEERNVIISHYFKDLNQDSIAKEINTSQVRVSRLEKKGISRMRKLMEV
jgi:RNA polymerase sigma factor (sigma-70 family)